MLLELGLLALLELDDEAGLEVDGATLELDGAGVVDDGVTWLDGVGSPLEDGVGS